MKQYHTLFLFLFGIGLSLNAQTDSYSEVYKTLKANDSLLFQHSFNKCELQYLDQLISDDFEFYHNNGGILDTKKQFIQTMKDGICDSNNTTKSSKELVGELQVFPLYSDEKLYGALQNDIHNFHETTNRTKVAGSTAKFSHLWLL